MSSSLNYSSTVVDSVLSASFDQALKNARAFDKAVPSYVDGKAIAGGDVSFHPDPCDPSRAAARYHAAGDDLVEKAVSSARAASKEWRAAGHKKRCELLRLTKPEFLARQAEIAGIVSRETGKNRVEALAELAEAADIVEYYAAQIDSNCGYVVDLQPGKDETRQDVLRPYGVFGVISPFNFPVALAVNMTTAALLTGNTVVVKPSAKTPRSTTESLLVLARHLPAGVLNIVQGDVATGEALVGSDVDGIAFTGSAQVGWSIVSALQAHPRRKPVLAEMGGQNPAIVAADADLDAAAEGILRSAFGLSGQKCSACRRVVVEQSVAKQLAEKLVQGARALKVADPSDPQSNLGPVIDRAIASRIDAALEEASRVGKVHIGGRVDALDGFYYSPIIVGDLPAGHALSRNELFAPFLTITAVPSFAAAIEEANAVDYGLSAGVYSRSADNIARFLDEIEAGVVYVNRPSGATTGAWPGAQPFCGWKSSGSSGKGGLGPWYLPGFMREQSRTVVG